MKTIKPHISGGERSRTLFVLAALVAFALALLGSTACQAEAGSSAYPWPVKPFDKPHPIRGSFGDPRTVFNVPPSVSGLMTGGGKFNFHFGVDIWAPNGTPVFPVRDGTVTRVERAAPREYVEVDASGGHVFQYWHIKAVVRPGDRVRAGETVLGPILAPFEHVHFAELRNGQAVNPLASGHLTPYEDATRPEVASISVRATETGPALLPSFVSGRVILVAEAYDTRQLAIPGVWQPMPVTPSRVAWQLETLAGETVAGGVAADFRSVTPPGDQFWSYYARGTYQNMAVFGPRYSWGQPGCFLFKLTRSSFDTRRVPDGVYDLVVSVADIRGNTGSKSLRITIHNRAGW